MKNVFMALTLVCCFLFPAQGYSSSEGDIEVLTSYRFKSKTEHFSKQVEVAFQDPNAVSVDFSRVVINDEDLNTVVLHEIKHRSLLNAFQKLDLINLGTGQAEGISRRGLICFLESLEKIAQDGDGKVYAVMATYILKTGLTLSEELAEEIQEAAPILIARKLRIIE